MKVSADCLAGAAALILLLAPALAPAAAPAGRYTVAGGVVQDNKTGLHWQQATAPMTYNLADAKTYCLDNAAALPGSGWHLPAIKELLTLIDDSSVRNPKIDASAFPATPADLFWSSTPDGASTSGAWVLNTDGTVQAYYMTEKVHVRCVR